jgi:hypothetical protein
MAQRGRKGSKADILSIVPRLPGERAPAPPELSEEERRIWNDVVRNMREDWFNPAIAPLLRAYSCECVAGDVLGRRLRELQWGDPDYRGVAAMHRAAAKSIASLATKLRLTPSSNRQSIRNEIAPAGPRPWEIRASDEGGDAS